MGGGAGGTGGDCGVGDGGEIAQLTYAAHVPAQKDGAPTQLGVGAVTQKAHGMHCAHTDGMAAQLTGAVATGDGGGGDARMRGGGAGGFGGAGGSGGSGWSGASGGAGGDGANASAGGTSHALPTTQSTMVLPSESGRR